MSETKEERIEKYRKWLNELPSWNKLFETYFDLFENQERERDKKYVISIFAAKLLTTSTLDDLEDTNKNEKDILTEIENFLKQTEINLDKIENEFKTSLQDFERLHPNLKLEIPKIILKRKNEIKKMEYERIQEEIESKKKTTQDDSLFTTVQQNTFEENYLLIKDLINKIKEENKDDGWDGWGLKSALMSVIEAIKQAFKYIYKAGIEKKLSFNDDSIMKIICYSILANKKYEDYSFIYSNGWEDEKLINIFNKFADFSQNRINPLENKPINLWNWSVVHWDDDSHDGCNETVYFATEFLNESEQKRLVQYFWIVNEILEIGSDEYDMQRGDVEKIVDLTNNDNITYLSKNNLEKLFKIFDLFNTRKNKN